MQNHTSQVGEEVVKRPAARARRLQFKILSGMPSAILLGWEAIERIEPCSVATELYISRTVTLHTRSSTLTAYDLND